MLACYLLVGQPSSSRHLVSEARQAEALGLDAAFISERYNKNKAALLSGAASALSERIRIITAPTNDNTRHPMVTAGYDRNHAVPHWRPLHPRPRPRTAAPHDVYGITRDHDSQASGLRGADKKSLPRRSRLRLARLARLYLDSSLAEHLPMRLTAFGVDTLELACKDFDYVALDTDLHRRGHPPLRRRRQDHAHKAGKDIRVWSRLATVPDNSAARLAPEEDRRPPGHRPARVRRPAGAHPNGWDPAALRRFLEDEVII